MYRKSIFLLAMVLGYLSFSKIAAQTADEIYISGNFRNVPLTSFFDVLKKDYGLDVYYKKDWVASYTINISFDNNPLTTALNSIFNGHELTYEIFQDKTIIVFPRKLD